LPSADVDFATTRTWKHLYEHVIRDQKDVIQFPRKIGRHWVPFVALTAVTAGLIALDPADTPYFRRTSRFEGFNEVASGLNTGAAMAAIPALFYLTRARASDSYGRRTVFVAAEAMADVQILTFVAKMIDRRIRPSDVAPGGDYADTWFKADVLGGKSFPSGHTITAFALADVFVERYQGHRWIPWVAYGMATTVGFSRLTLQAHFPADVFAGGALGIVMAHGLVLHRSR
jgi:membrane-associated phospholipid phosphatase